MYKTSAFNVGGLGMNKEQNQSSRLVLSGDKKLTRHSLGLVRRGLVEIAHLTITSEQIEKIRSDLYDHNFDVRAQAAQTVIDLSLYLRIMCDEIRYIMIALIDNLHENFERRWRQLDLFDCGEKYYPPNQEFKEILRHALELLTGPISEAGDAIIWLFLHGNNETKITSTEWLGRNNIYKAAPLLREALDNTSDEPLKLALRYALSCFGEEDLDTFCQDLAKYARSSSDDAVIDQCGDYLTLLSVRVSSDVLGE